MSEAPTPRLAVGLVGYGAIGRVVTDALAGVPGLALVGAIVHDPHARRTGGGALPFFSRIDQLLECRPRLVLECAGHAALRQHGISVLEAGIELLAASAGALADETRCVAQRRRA